jgi:protein-tyrosine phosphatase
VGDRFPVAVALPDGGRIGLMPMPGRLAPLSEDVAAIAAFGASVVLTLTELREMRPYGADKLPELLGARGIRWLHLPFVDFGAPEASGRGRWETIGPQLHRALDAPGAIVLHCHGGCGRTGMAAMRLMVERGEAPQAALARLRAVRPCSVETAGQMEWGSSFRPKRSEEPGSGGG